VRSFENVDDVREALEKLGHCLAPGVQGDPEWAGTEHKGHIVGTSGCDPVAKMDQHVPQLP
jgi:hypothetical protein